MQNCSGGIWLAGSSAGLRVLWGLSWLKAAKQKPSHRCYEPVCGGCSEQLKYLFSFPRGRLWITHVIFLGLTLAHDQNCSGLSRLAGMIQCNRIAVPRLHYRQHGQPFLFVHYIRAKSFSCCFLPFFPLALLVLQH